MSLPTSSEAAAADLAWCLQAAVNVSVVRGRLSRERAANMSARGPGVAAGDPYAAAALSLVFHPAHPLVPTLRADVRLFECRPEGASISIPAHALRYFGACLITVLIPGCMQYLEFMCCDHK